MNTLMRAELQISLVRGTQVLLKDLFQLSLSEILVKHCLFKGILVYFYGLSMIRRHQL